DAGFELAKGLVNALPSLLEEVPTMVSNLLQNIFDLIGSINWGELLGSVVETATGVIGSIFETITRNSSESMQAWYDHRDAINEDIAAGRIRSGSITFKEIELEDEHDDYPNSERFRPVYKIECYSGRDEYDIEIDAVTGKILKFKLDD
ncbi:MAG: PepSY domain-containing protein, partial [Synergistaceae bacterium]|nr:PepSY domain-containing protein [Synergistaceae bacterium]